MINIFTGFTLLDGKYQQYWCCKLLESAYHGFKMLRLHKVLPNPTTAYGHIMIQCSSICLTQLQTLSTDAVSMLVILVCCQVL